MSKVLIRSIQGTQITLYENNCLQQFNSNVSHIDVEDLETGKKLDWKLGIFTQSKGQFLTEKEIAQLSNYGFDYVYINPNETAPSRDPAVGLSLLTKLGFVSSWDYASDTDDCRTRKAFDGYIIIGEMELKKAIELNKYYNKDIINSSSFKPM